MRKVVLFLLFTVLLFSCYSSPREKNIERRIQIVKELATLSSEYNMTKRFIFLLDSLETADSLENPCRYERDTIDEIVTNRFREDVRMIVLKKAQLKAEADSLEMALEMY